MPLLHWEYWNGVRDLPKPYVNATGIPTRMLSVEVTGGVSLGNDCRLLELEIRHAPNEHGTAWLVMQLQAEVCKKFVEQTTIKDKIKIRVGKGSDKPVLFLGYVLEAAMENRMDRSLLILDLADASYLQDLKKESRSYQNTRKKYQDILSAAYGSEGTVKLKDSLNKAIEKMVVQMDETNWEFAKRMASRFNVPLLSDLTAEKCSVFLGLKDGGNEMPLTTSRMESYVDAQSFERVSKNDWRKKQAATREDFSGLRVESYDYAYLGDKIKVNGTSYFIRKVFAKLRGGMLRMTYDLAPKEAGFLAPAIMNSTCAGRILAAQVKEVKKDQVQVHLIDIDKQYDTSGDTWLPYATAYSSKDGSGWYVMPEKGDYVRVLFPTAEESDAYVSSAINTAPVEKVRNKSFKAPGGKELLLTDEGVEIICEHQKIFVKLEKGKGISLVSSKNIEVSADGDISLNAKGKVQILAKSGIDLQAGSSHLKVLSNQVAMGGNAIKLGE